MLTEYERALTQPEQAMIREDIRRLQSDIKAEWQSEILSALLIAAAFAFFGWLGSRGGSPYLIWIMPPGCIGVLAYNFSKFRRVTRLDREMIADREALLRTSRGRVLRCEATEVVKVEQDDQTDGPLFAFQAEPSRIVVVDGETYGVSRRPDFPNDDFEILDLDAADGSEVLRTIRSLGRPIVPARVLPRSVRSDIKGPDGHDVLEGRVAELERAYALE